MKMLRLIIYSLWFISNLGFSEVVWTEVPCRLDVEVLPDRCRFRLVLTNDSDSQEIILHFPTSQQYDFVIKDRNGSIIWQWSDGKVFTQMVTGLLIPPKKEKEFVEDLVLLDGEYMVQGIIPAIPEKIYTDWVGFKVVRSQDHVIKGRITKILNNLYLLSEDGIAYLIVEPEEDISHLEGKSIEVTSYHIEPIPDSIDKKIRINEFKL